MTARRAGDFVALNHDCKSHVPLWVKPMLGCHQLTALDTLKHSKLCVQPSNSKNMLRRYGFGVTSTSLTLGRVFESFSEFRP